ncbi:MAG: RlmE family RNA methyltransferase, partial [Deltaproteobacteria bacterium]
MDLFGLQESRPSLAFEWVVRPRGFGGDLQFSNGDHLDTDCDGGYPAPRSSGRRDERMRKVQDHYFQRAKREHYPARSVYKLEAIDRKFSILRRGARVLDLGCAPGSWSQYAARIVGAKGLVVGIDRQGVALPKLENLRVIEGDVAAFTWEGEPFHVVLSDLAPATTGVKHTDHHRS